MASKRDLVEAYSYNRRRLVTAFVSGAPGGREVEPSRPGKAIFAGVVLAALVVGAGAMAGEIEPTVKDGWDDNSLVVVKGSGARYLAQDGKLFPVYNTASARLLSEPGKFKVVFAPQDRVAELPLAEEMLGIEGAPDAVPGPDDLLSSNWVSCVDQTGNTSLRISETPTAAPVANQAMVARTPDGRTRVLVGERAYPMDNRDVAPVLRQLALDTAPVYRVPQHWVAQFPQAKALVPLRLAAAGGASAVKGAAAGDVVVTQTAGGASRYVALSNGVAPLTAVQFQLYKLGAGNVREVPVQPTDLTNVATVRGLFPDTVEWPADVPTAYAVKAACATIRADGEAQPVIALSQPLAGYLTPTAQGAVQVDPGKGAFVRSIERPELLYLVDSRGVRYQVGAGVERIQLGYAKKLPSFMPEAWFTTLPAGPALTASNIQGPVSGSSAPASPAPASPSPAAVPAKP